MKKQEIEDFLKFAKENAKKSPTNFTYQPYILPHNDMCELLGKIIEAFQCLERDIKNLLKLAMGKGIYHGKNEFNFDKYSAANIIDSLRKDLIKNNEIADKLILIIRFRNYVIHEYTLHNNRSQIEESFPDFLCMIFEVNDYIQNLINKVSGSNAVHIRNVFDTMQ